jgi:hypothetical protein
MLRGNERGQLLTLTERRARAVLRSLLHNSVSCCPSLGRCCAEVRVKRSSRIVVTSYIRPRPAPPAISWCSGRVFRFAVVANQGVVLFHELKLASQSVSGAHPVPVPVQYPPHEPVTHQWVAATTDTHRLPAPSPTTSTPTKHPHLPSVAKAEESIQGKRTAACKRRNAPPYLLLDWAAAALNARTTRPASLTCAQRPS